MTPHISLITPDRLANLRRAVERTAHLPGDMAELGVYKGGSARMIAEACPRKTLYLFDTFAGLPHDELPERDPKALLKAGMFACGEEEARGNLRGCRTVFHAGDFADTAPKANLSGLSFVHVDCDLGSAASASLLYFWPRMVESGIIYFDDYGCDFTGVTEAVDAFFRPEQIEKHHDVHGFQIGAMVVKPLGGGEI